MTDTRPGDTGRKTGPALVDELANQIRLRIMSGEIPIGGQLRQAELADVFGVSRTPIREALRQLQTSGLIAVVPNRGAVVRVPAPWEVREAYEVRAELEALATARAVSRITRNQLEQLRNANCAMHDAASAEADGTAPAPVADGASGQTDHRRSNDVFHTAIVTTSGNVRLAKAINDINEAFPRSVTAHLIITDSRQREENFQQHERILEALAEGDAERAADEMRRHVITAGEQLARWYEQRSSTVFRG